MATSVETAAIIDVAGCRIRYAVHGQGSNAPVVCIHGAGPGASGEDTFAAMVEGAAEQQHPIITFDLPGYGESEPVDSSSGDLLQLLVRIVTELSELVGGSEVRLVGHSLGGGLAVQCARELRGRVRDLLLIAPAGIGVPILAPVPTEGQRALQAFLAAPSEGSMTNLLLTQFFDSARANEEASQRRLASFRSTGGAEAVRAVLGTLDRQLWRSLPDIPQPIEFIWGRDDRVVPMENALWALRHAKSAVLHLVAEAGHVPQVEQTAHVSRIFSGWLNR